MYHGGINSVAGSVIINNVSSISISGMLMAAWRSQRSSGGYQYGASKFSWRCWKRSGKTNMYQRVRQHQHLSMGSSSIGRR